MEETQQLMADQLTTLTPPSEYKKSVLVRTPLPAAANDIAQSTNRRRHGKDTSCLGLEVADRWIRSCVQLYTSHHKESQGSSHSHSSKGADASEFKMGECP